MCLIIRTRKPSKVSKAEVISALKENPDGVGVMYYADNGDIITEKVVGYSGEKIFAFLRKHGKLAEKSNSDFAIHFRYRTSGPIDVEHAHPYPVFEDSVQMMHNGVISGFGTATRSDTFEYAAFLSELVKDSTNIDRFLRNDSVRALIEDNITEDNRLVFAVKGSPDKSLIVYNEHTGYDYDGKWYSNLYGWDAFRLTGGKLGFSQVDEQKSLDAWLSRGESEGVSQSPSYSGFDYYDLDEADFKYLFEDSICPQEDIGCILDWYDASVADAIDLIGAVSRSHPNEGDRKWYAGVHDKIQASASLEEKLDILKNARKYVVKAYAQYCY